VITLEYAIETHGLKKYFGDIHAVDGIDLKIPKGYLYGYLDQMELERRRQFECYLQFFTQRTERLRY